MGRFINRKPIEIKLTDQQHRYVPIFDSGSNTWTTTDELLSLEVFEVFSSSFATGSFSGSFTGDGSGLENLDIFGIKESFLDPVPFTNQTTVNVSHNLDIEYPVVQVYDENKNQLIPDSIISIDNNNVQVNFITETTGFIVVMKGGHVLGSYGTVASNFSEQTTVTVNHNLNAPSPFVQVYNEVNEQIVPLKVKVLDKDNVQVTFSTPRSGQIVITRGGHIAIPSEFIESFSGSFTGSFLSQTNFLPSETDVYDLGSPDKRWRDLYLSGSSIFLGDVVLTEEASELTIKDSSGNNVPLQGTAASASYVEFTDVANKPALVSGSSQVSFSGISDKPSLVSGSSQIELNQISGNEFISQSYAFPSNLTIRGNLVVSGSTFIEDTQTIQVTDNLLIVNSGEQGEGVTSTIAGIQIDRGTATDFQFIFDETSKDFQVGEIGDLQSVATRQTEPTNAGIPFWNGSENRFDNSSNATLDSNGNLQASSFTGSIDFSNLENSPTLVSGSSQVSFTDISDKPTLVSGSSQITLSDTDGFTEYSGSVSSTLETKVGRTSLTGSAIIPTGSEADRDLNPQPGFFRFNSDESKFEGYDGTEWGEIGGGEGVPLSASIDDTDSPFTITNQRIIIADTTSGSITANLPALSTIVGTIDQRPILIYKNDYSQNVIFVETNGVETINGKDRDILAGIQQAVIFHPTTDGWTVESQNGRSIAELAEFFVERENIVNDLTTGGTAVPLSAEQGKVLNLRAIPIDFLVIAGGGNGASHSTGGSSAVASAPGGAGGYRCSMTGEKSGGNTDNEPKYLIDLDAKYRIIVGANASDSRFANIISLKGGNGRGAVGGSGGGGDFSQIAGALGTLDQGTKGGDGIASTSSGGGGGASEAGANGSGSTGGKGGDGITSSITGTPVTRAGGGGGSGTTAGAGGAGGGATGKSSTGEGNTGTPNTGGGGSGAFSTAPGLWTGGVGGSGVVILRYPNYLSLTIGAGLTSTTSTDGDFKVTEFTAGADTIKFNLAS